MADAAQSRHFKKGDVKLPLETAPNCGRVKAQCDNITLAPAACRLFLERSQQYRNCRIGISLRRHGMTPFARSKARLQAKGNSFKETAIFPFRFAGRAGQATEDPGRRDTNIGTAIKARVAGHKSIIEDISVWELKQHPGRINQSGIFCRLKSGVYLFFRIARRHTRSRLWFRYKVSTSQWRRHHCPSIFPFQRRPVKFLHLSIHAALWRLVAAIRKRLATKAASLRQALPAGFAPVTW